MVGASNSDDHCSSSEKTFYLLFTVRWFQTTMAEGRMDLLRQAVRNMLVALQMPDVDDDELQDLTARIGHTGK